MGTSAANDGCDCKWIAPLHFGASAVKGRSVAVASEKGAQNPSAMLLGGLETNRRTGEAVLYADRDISRCNSGGKVPWADYDS